MEVICVRDFKGALKPGNWYGNGYPIEGETYFIDDADEICFEIKQFNCILPCGKVVIHWWDKKGFEVIDSLSNEIKSALSAKNPNIKKYSLLELKIIGYDVPMISEKCVEWSKRLGLV